MNQSFSTNVSPSEILHAGGASGPSLLSLFYDLLNTVLDNQYFVTTAIVVILGTIGTMGYYIFSLLFDLFQRTFIITVTLDNSSEMFDWVVRWLSEQEVHKGFLRSTSSTLQVYVKRFSTMDWWTSEQNGSGEDTSIELLPGLGLHVIKFRNKSIWTHRYEASKITTVGSDNKPFLKEFLELSAYGRDHTIFTELFNEARATSARRDSEKTKVYTMHEYGYMWVMASAKDPRSLDSVILDTDLSDKILEDAKEFLATKDWYLSVGLPYRRGYLLYGPPGCGKTSFVSALAAKLNFSICCLTLSSKNMSDESLNERLHDAPGNAIILLEDIDSVFVDRNVADAHNSTVTFSGLLNSIDGVASQEGRLFFMTTNHIEKLDPALLRPGRCDVRVEFKRASKKQILEMFKRFYPKKEFPNVVDEKLQQKLLNSLPEFTVPMAALQEHFMRYRANPVDAVENYHEILSEVKSENSEYLFSSDSQLENDSKREKEPTGIVGDDISVWLTRLGLSKYISSYRKHKAFGLNEVMSDIDFKTPGEMTRLEAMLNGRKDVVADFEYANASLQKKLFIAQFDQYQSDLERLEKMADTFVANIAGVSVSIHQIKDHLLEFAKDMEEAATMVSGLTNPPQTLTSDEEKLKVYDGNQTIRSWILADTKYLRKLNQELREQVCNKLEEQEVITLDDLTEMDDSLEDIVNLGKKGYNLALTSAVDAIKELKGKVNSK